MVHYQCCWLSGQGDNSFPDSAWGSRSEQQKTAAQEGRNSNKSWARVSASFTKPKRLSSTWMMMMMVEMMKLVPGQAGANDPRERNLKINLYLILTITSRKKHYVVDRLQSLAESWKHLQRWRNYMYIKYEVQYKGIDNNKQLTYCSLKV